MAGIKEEKKIYLVGIYCRLSKDDGTDNESASIATQKSILTDYVKKQGWHIAKTYVDDGYSGTNFQRPSFQNMIKDIDKILVSEREKMADGTVKQEIKIYYKFIGFVDELHIIPTKRWAAMPAKNCTVCGVEYVPGSGASRYCPACAKKIRREKSNESKRRSREQKRIACMNCPQKMTD